MNKSGGSDSKDTLYCSFCGRSQHDVAQIIAGPRVFICDKCVDLCMGVIRDARKSTLVKSRDGGDPKNALYCSFCGKSQHDVGQLIGGPTVFICDECIDLCMGLIRDARKSTLDKSRDGGEVTDEDD